MTINKTMRAVLSALSYGEIQVDAARAFANLKALDPLKIFNVKIDSKIYNGNFEVPVRVFFPSEEVKKKTEETSDSWPVMIYFHGGGWVTDSLDNYERICAMLSKSTGKIVIVADYRLAPEHPFPAGLEDCYTVACSIFHDEFIFKVDRENVTIIGDSAGGNLAAAVCLLARDRNEFKAKNQILIYPATNNDYSEHSVYKSVHENGSDYLLTCGKLQDYLNLYQSKEEDRLSPYFAPILEDDLTNLPRALVITAEFDPLRDEGEDYGRRMKDAGNEVEIHRIKDALHGYFALGIKYLHVQESLDLINQFIGEE
ncbi:MAG: alpha/beta hydrolase [Hespellia sp.]|nr:alpha/beta hydrolase [Hespellia sp.]